MIVRDVTELVAAAADHDEEAWAELVGRYAGLVASTMRRYRLRPVDTQDITQLVWLHLIEHLARLREPAALPGWLVTTTRHECERHLQRTGRLIPIDPVMMGSPVEAPEVDGPLLAREWRTALLDGLAELHPQQRRLLVLLSADPPRSYAEIGHTLGIPIGSIGPTRARAIAKLRATSAVRAYIVDHPGSVVPLHRHDRTTSSATAA
jgi:RNA polymerase sigma factor (sigma-70 family)